jgi:hypothetical protein
MDAIIKDAWRQELQDAGASGWTPEGALGAKLALQATGLCSWDAMMALVDAGVSPAAFAGLMDLPSRLVRKWSHLCDTLEALDSEAGFFGNPDGARRALAAYFTGRAVRGGFALDLRLPWLRQVPGGIVVDEALLLQGAIEWDGQLPADLHVGYLVFTDAHPQGVSLKNWRRLHPRGEREERHAQP